MKHLICALKGNKTIHDSAELTLYTVEEYNKLMNGTVILDKSNYNPKGDAVNINMFLTEHLPDETLVELKKLLI